MQSRLTSPTTSRAPGGRRSRVSRIPSRLVLLVAGIAATLPAQQGFFAQHWEPKVYTPPSNATASALPTGRANLVFSIDPTDTVQKVLPTLYGNNLAAWTKKIQDGSNQTIWEHPYTLRHLRNAGISQLRLPGGAWANSWFWDKNPTRWALKSDLTSTTIYTDGLATWSMTFEEMLRTCDSIGAEPQPIVNMGLAREIDEPNPVQKAASYAAAWVRHAKSLGRNIEVWEVGNEDYGRWMVNWEVAGDTITGTKYGQAFNVFADSMKAADPRIKVGAVLYPDFKERPTGYQIPRWTEDVITTTRNHADFYIVHEYFTYNSVDMNLVTSADVLAGRDKIARQKADLDSLILALTGKGIPVAMTEFNMAAGHKNTSLVSTLFFAEALGEFAKAGYGLVNAWNIGNGKGTDDHGMLARADGEAGGKGTVITPSQAEESTPHPHFFSYYYYGRYFGDAVVGSSGGDDGTHLYATTFSNGHLGLVLVNETSQARVVELNLKNLAAKGRMHWHTVTGDSLAGRSIVINGNGPPAGKVYGPRDYETIAANSAEIGTEARSVLFEAPKYSASFLSIPLANGAPVGVEQARLARAGGDLRLSLSGGRIHFELPAPTPVTLRVYDLRGNLVGRRDLGNLVAGPHSTSARLDAPLPKGLLLVRIDAGGGQGGTLLANDLD